MQLDKSFYDEVFFDTLTHGQKCIQLDDGRVITSTAVSTRGEWSAWTPILIELCQLMHLPLSAETKLLDAGCGCGSLVLQANQLGLDATGVDFSEAAKTLSWSPEHIVVADLMELPFPDNCYDLVTCSSTMEHIYSEDVKPVLDELFRVGKQWFFFNIDGCDGSMEDVEYILKKTDIVPEAYAQEFVKGHVTMKPRHWWKRRFGKRGRFREAMVDTFLETIDFFRDDSYKFILEKTSSHLKQATSK